MKKHFKRILSLIVAAVTLLTLVPAVYAGKSVYSYKFYALTENNPGLPFNLGIHEDQHFSNKFWVFLPNTFEGDTITVSARSPITSSIGTLSVADDKKSFVMSAKDGARVLVNGATFTVMYSCLPSVNITIDQGYSIDTIHDDKEAKIKAHVRIDGTEETEYDLPSTEIEMKTRGNTTFYFDKKPYQIKFDKKTDLFGMGKAKKWILLANYIDGTGVRNKISFDLAEELGLACTPESVFVDLYIDGEYKGNYQVIEKIEVGSSRVPLKDDKGVIFEMDTDLRVDSTDINFRGSFTNKTYTLKDYVTDLEDNSTPEKAEKNREVLTFITDYMDEFEEILYDPDSKWEDVEKYIDAESFIQYYFVTELTEQIDCTLASTYFYIDGPDDVLHCGPIWDFDRICGWQNDYDQTWNTDYVKNMVENTDYQRCDLFKQLFRYPEFAKAANDFYDEKVRDAFETEKLIGMIDSYQEELWPSLMMNFSRWYYVFRDRTTTMEDVQRNGSYEEWVNYVTDLMKNWLINRNKYLTTAYGSDFPIISYSVHGEIEDMISWDQAKDMWHPAVTGGSMTYLTSVDGLKMYFSDTKLDGKINYSLYSAGKEYSASDGEAIFDENTSAYTGLSVFLSGNVANYFNIEYRVLQARNVRDNKGFVGWSSWVSNGSVAGSKSSNLSSYAIKKIQIRLTAKKPVSYGSVVTDVFGVRTDNKGIIGNFFNVDDPSAEGYRFDGWYFTPDFSGSSVYKVNYTASGLVLYAKMVELPPRVVGDVNYDGEVDLKDVLMLRKYVAAVGDLDEDSLKSADMNGDGEADLKDVLILRKIVAGVA